MGRRKIIVTVLATALLVAPLAVWAGDRFEDVPDENIFHDDIGWLADSGVTFGCNPPANTQFCPDDNVTREQMAAFMRRLSEGKVVDAATAIEADHATTADSATEADHATTADSADDSALLDGKDPHAYRHVIAVDSHGTELAPIDNLATGDHQLASVEITVPAAGLILVEAMNTWEVAGSDSNVLSWIEMDTASPCDAYADGDLLSGSLGEIWVDGDDTFGSGTATSVAPVLIDAAGTHTFYSCAQVQVNPIDSWDRTLVAEWTFEDDSSATISEASTSGSGDPAEVGAGTE